MNYERSLPKEELDCYKIGGAIYKEYDIMCLKYHKQGKRNKKLSMTKNELQFKKMTETPVWKLVITLGIPTTISMLITNIYNMADTYFVSTLGTAEGGAPSIVFSIMAILQAFGFMFGHGAGSHVSRLLGTKDDERAGTPSG